MTGSVTAGMLAAAVLVWPRRPDPVRRLLDLYGGPAPGPSGVLRLLVDARRRVRDWSGRRTTLAALDRELVPLLEGLAATMRAGLTPARAFAHLATSGPAADPLLDPLVDPRADPLGGLRARLAAEAARGARLEPTWRAAAERSASPALLAVAEGWGLSERHGAPVVEVLDALVGALRDQMRTAAAVETALAAPRATARLLAVLPVGGVVLGELVGVHPLAVLVGTAAGRVAGVLGLAATLGGRLWMRRLVASVAGPT